MQHQPMTIEQVTHYLLAFIVIVTLLCSLSHSFTHSHSSSRSKGDPKD